MSETSFVLQLLQNTLEHNQAHISEATQKLDQISLNPGFANVLFGIICDQSTTPSIVQAATVYLKNLIVYKWIHDTSIDSSPTINPQDKEFIKKNIVTVFLRSQLSRSHLRASIEFMAAFDFPHAWPSLLPQIHQLFNEAKSTTNLDAMTACMAILCSVVRNFVSESETNELVNTIKETALIMGQDIVVTMSDCIGQVRRSTSALGEHARSSASSGPAAEKAVLQQIVTINGAVRLLYYLIKAQYLIVFHDITGIFEKKIIDIMGMLLNALNLGKELNTVLRSVMSEMGTNANVNNIVSNVICESISSENYIRLIYIINKSVSHLVSICLEDIQSSIPPITEAVYNNAITIVSGDCGLQTCQQYSNINVIHSHKVSNKLANKCIVSSLTLLELVTSVDATLFKNSSTLSGIITGIIIPSVIDVSGSEIPLGGAGPSGRSVDIPLINESAMELVEDDPMLYIQSIIVSNIGNASVPQIGGAQVSVSSTNTTTIGNTGDNKVSCSIKFLSKLVAMVGEEAELMINSAIVAILLCIGVIGNGNIQAELNVSDPSVVFTKLCGYYQLIGKEINPDYLKTIINGNLFSNVFLPYYYTGLFRMYVGLFDGANASDQETIIKNKKMLLVTVMHMNMALNGNGRRLGVMSPSGVDSPKGMKIFSSVSIQDSFVSDIVIPQLSEADKRIMATAGKGIETADVVVLCEALRYSILSLLSNGGIATVTSSSTVMTENSLLLVKRISNFLISYITQCSNFVLFTYSSLILSVIINYKCKTNTDPSTSQIISVLSKNDISALLEPLCNFVFKNIQQVPGSGGNITIDLSQCYLLNGPSGERYANPYVLDLLSSVINNCSFEALYNNIFKSTGTSNNVLEVVLCIVSDILKSATSNTTTGSIASAAFENSLFGVLASILNTITDISGSILKIVSFSNVDASGATSPSAVNAGACVPAQAQVYMYNNYIGNRVYNLPIVNASNISKKCRYNSISPNELSSTSIPSAISGITQTSRMLESKLLPLFNNIIQAVSTYQQQHAPTNLLDSVAFVLDLLSKMVELGDIVGQLDVGSQCPTPSAGSSAIGAGGSGQGIKVISNNTLNWIFSSQIISAVLSQSLWSYPTLIKNLSILVGNIGAYSYIPDLESEVGNTLVSTESAARVGILECASLLVSRYAKLRVHASKIIIGCAAGKRVSRQAVGKIPSLSAIPVLVSEFYTAVGALVVASTEQGRSVGSTRGVCVSLLLNLFSSLTPDVFCPILSLVGKGAKQGTVSPTSPIVTAACGSQSNEDLQLVGRFIKEIIAPVITPESNGGSGGGESIALPMKKGMIMSIVGIINHANTSTSPLSKAFAVTGVPSPHPLGVELLKCLATLVSTLNTRTGARGRARMQQQTQVTEGMTGSSLCPCGVAQPLLAINNDEMLAAILSLGITQRFLMAAGIPPESLPTVG